MARWPNADEKKEEVVNEVKPEVSPEVKPEAKAFKCARCGGVSKELRFSIEVCSECFAPTNWTA